MPALSPHTHRPRPPHTPLPPVSVRAPARLHLGFLDPAAHLGRRFGSLGLVIDGFETQVDLAPAAHDLLDTSPAVQATGVEGQQALQRVQAHLAALRQHTGLASALHIRLQRLPPAHAGFGSGTQLALAVGRAFALHHGLQLPTATLAAWLGRGLRSGVGIAGFDQGGLLLDGGPSTRVSAAGQATPAQQTTPFTQPAPLLARLALPPEWRVLLVLDPRLRGLSGADEKRALATLQPLSQMASADLCHQVLMRVLPGAADAHFEAFAAGVTHLQQVLGAHFAPVQAGRSYTSAAVQRLLQWLGAAAGPDGAAIGQSSWGPTGFAILPSEARVETLLQAALAAGVVDPALMLSTVTARNEGAQWRVGDAAAAEDAAAVAHAAPAAPATSAAP